MADIMMAMELGYDVPLEDMYDAAGVDPEDFEDCDYEVGFDPYMGEYSFDC